MHGLKWPINSTRIVLVVPSTDPPYHRRHFHPTAGGVFSYWSQRAGNRSVNRGLRLDYTIVSASMLSDGGSVQLVDSFVLDDTAAVPAFSDHAPIGALISLSGG